VGGHKTNAAYREESWGEAKKESCHNGKECEQKTTAWGGRKIAKKKQNASNERTKRDKKREGRVKGTGSDRESIGGKTAKKEGSKRP